MTPEEPILLWRDGPVEGTEYRVGCSSWLDTSLVNDGHFYPAPRMSAEARLRWYAQFFDCVEVNATYYALPSMKNAELWAARTPPGFQFAVKAYALMTGHHPKADRLPKDLRLMLPDPLPINERGEIDRKHFPSEALSRCFQWFREALEPLDAAGKLSYILFQFAPWVGYSDRVLNYLASLPEQLPGWRIAVEFRNSSWIPDRTDEVLHFLAEHELIFVALDCPWQPLIPAATADWAVLRFHGQNLKGWRAQLEGKSPTVAEKYEYLYNDDELDGLAQTTRAFHGKVRKVFTKFNNNYRDFPIRNALALRRRLGQEAPEPEAMKATWQPSRRVPRPRAADDDLGLFR